MERSAGIRPPRRVVKETEHRAREGAGKSAGDRARNRIRRTECRHCTATGRGSEKAELRREKGEARSGLDWALRARAMPLQCMTGTLQL